MSDPKRIEEGDVVQVILDRGEGGMVDFVGRVLRRPYGEGDSWTLETISDPAGEIVNVQRYESMWLREKHSDPY